MAARKKIWLKKDKGTAKTFDLFACNFHILNSTLDLNELRKLLKTIADLSKCDLIDSNFIICNENYFMD